MRSSRPPFHRSLPSLILVDCQLLYVPLPSLSPTVTSSPLRRRAVVARLWRRLPQPCPTPSRCRRAAHRRRRRAAAATALPTTVLPLMTLRCRQAAKVAAAAALPPPPPPPRYCHRPAAALPAAAALLPTMEGKQRKDAIFHVPRALRLGPSPEQKAERAGIRWVHIPKKTLEVRK